MKAELEDNICPHDYRLSQLSERSPEIHLFQRLYNPLHFYCRLKDCGVEANLAGEYSRIYEKVYVQVMKEINNGHP